MRMYRLLATGILAATLGAMGCAGCDEDPAGQNDAGGGGGTLPVGGTDGGTTGGTDGGTVVEERYTLSFVGASPVTVYFGDSVDLAFRLTDATTGQPVSGQNVAFSLNGVGGTLDWPQRTTDAAGVAMVPFNAGTMVANPIVTATTDDAADVRVSLQIVQNPTGQLVISVADSTRVGLARADALVFTAAPGQAAVTCESLEMATTLPTAAFSADFDMGTGTRTFNGLDHGQKVTVLASGYSARGDLIASGCNDGAGMDWTVQGGATLTVPVALAQLPTTVTGEYEALLKMELVSALPDPYETYVRTVTDLLTDPAGYATYLVLRGYDGANDPMTVPDGDSWTSYRMAPCGDPVYRWATFDEISSLSDDCGITYNLFNIGRNAMSGVVDNVTNGALTEVQNIGANIEGLTEEFEIGATYTITPLNPELGGYTVNEEWNRFVFKWNIGCDHPGDLKCVRRAVTPPADMMPPFRAVQTTYGATIQHAIPTGDAYPIDERFVVTPEDGYAMELAYGSILILAMNQLVFPSLPGGLAGNSLHEVLNNLVDCQSLGGSIGSSLCTAGLAAADAYVTNELDGLTIGGGDDNVVIGKDESGVTGGGTFSLIDADGDLKTELVREVDLYVQYTDPDNPGASQDIFAPITGHGRLAADACAQDTDCEAGFACVPVAHVLETAAIEMDCRPIRGMALGGGDCMADTDCRSGHCLGATPTAAGTCYQACDADAQCGAGNVCATDADAGAFEYNVEGVLAQQRAVGQPDHGLPLRNGLGAVAAPTCVEAPAP